MSYDHQIGSLWVRGLPEGIESCREPALSTRFSPENFPGLPVRKLQSLETSVGMVLRRTEAGRPVVRIKNIAGKGIDWLSGLVNFTGSTDLIL